MGFTSDRVTRVTVMDQLIGARAASLRSGVTVNPSTVAGLPAIQSAVEFAAEAVAQLSIGVWRTGTVRSRVTDVWQAQFFGRRPNPMQDDFEFWHTVAASLDYRSNGYVWKTKLNGKVIARTALHPAQVEPRREPNGYGVVYDVYFLEGYPVPPDVNGYGMLTMGPEVVLHIKGRGGSGELVTPSPIRRFQKALGLAIGKQEHESSLLKNGAGYGLIASFPPTVKQEDAEKWRDRHDARHAGPAKHGRTQIIGGGATLSTVSMSQADAQFVESVELSMRDMCHIYHVPEWLLGIGVGTKSATRPVTPEHEMQRWSYFYLGPRLSRIESAFNADPDFFGDTDLRCFFDTFDIIRGDLATEDTISHNKVQDGRLLVDEWRIEHGLPPLPNGLGMIPQITPVGGAPNPVTKPVEQTQDDDEE